MITKTVDLLKALEQLVTIAEASNFAHKDEFAELVSNANKIKQPYEGNPGLKRIMKLDLMLITHLKNEGMRELESEFYGPEATLLNAYIK